MQRIYTERAHLMCPNMFFGIVISVDAAFDRDKISEAVNALSEAHPFLRALLGKDDDGFFYRGKGHWNLKGNQIISRVEQSYCYENHNDWEWHNVKEDADTALVSVNGDKMTMTVVWDSSTGELMTGTLTRLK